MWYITRYAVVLAILTVVTPATAADHIAGNALSFNGVDNYISVPDFSFRGTQLTVETWISVGTFKTYGKILDFGGSGAGVRFTLQVEATGLNFNLDGGAGDITKVTRIPLSDNAWHHVAATWNSAGDMAMYLDGQLVSTAWHQLEELNISPDAAHYFGRRYEYHWKNPWQYLHGVVDEVRIWGIERSAADVLSTWNTAVDPATNGLLAYWNFNEGSGNLAADATSNGYIAVLGDGLGNQMPTWVESGAPMIPEPATLSLLAFGLGACLMHRRRTRA